VSGSIYTNPVHDGYLGDPFVLKHNGEYYAYGTVPLGELSVPVLHSRDLVRWNPLGDALTLHDDAFDAVWAPEVAYRNGTFYMYYSAGGEEGQGHRLRVATAAHPAGPFEDRGVVLTPDEPFAIDAHPFRDETDGRWYLYYCRDFLDEEGGRVGTGIVADRLLEMTRLAGEPRVVVRPHADWHLYEARREWYGRVWDWHTVEGPFVLRRGGRYFCLYSGGAWREPNYGVSYVVADDPLGPFSFPEGRAEGPEVLRTRSGTVVGPGHASVAPAPNNLRDQIVYHAWDAQHARRLMRVDPLDWEGGLPSSPGPSLDPRPAPPLPAFRDLFDGQIGAPPDPAVWSTAGGDWQQDHGELVQRDPKTPLTTALLPASLVTNGGFLLEANAKFLDAGREDGRYGVVLEHGATRYTELALRTDGSGLLRDRHLDLEALGPGFGGGDYHRLVILVRGRQATVWVDGVRVADAVTIPSATRRLGLFAEGVSAAFASIALTPLAG
jgi:GH43 family beta-xylosidase